MSDYLRQGDVVRVHRSAFIAIRGYLNGAIAFRPKHLFLHYSVKTMKYIPTLREHGGIVVDTRGDRIVVEPLNPKVWPRKIYIYSLDLEKVDVVEAMRMCATWSRIAKWYK